MATAATKFASAERATAASLETHSHLLQQTGLLKQLYEAVNEIILILNQQRQIVFCNDHFAKLIGYQKSADLIGMRPGEAIGCIHACDVNGCGTSEFCSTCGAVRAILNAQQGNADIKECRVLQGQQSDAMDLWFAQHRSSIRVSASRSLPRWISATKSGATPWSASSSTI